MIDVFLAIHIFSAKHLFEYYMLWYNFLTRKLWELILLKIELIYSTYNEDFKQNYYVDISVMSDDDRRLYTFLRNQNKFKIKELDDEEFLKCNSIEFMFEKDNVYNKENVIHVGS
jgi:hypothetical protein